MTHKGQTFKIPVKITNGNVKEVEHDPNFDSVIVSIETSANTDGEINITIPRNLLDPKVDHRDDEFIVLVDGKEADYEEVNKSPCFRSLAIHTPAGSRKVEIIYAVIPEFYSPPITTVPPVYVATDKNNYQEWEIIKVSGCTSLALQDEKITLKILKPDGKIYRSIFPTPRIDGSFSASFMIAGERAINGTYTAEVTYAGESAQTTFEISKVPDVSVEFGYGPVFNLKTSLTNGNFTGAIVDGDTKMLTISLETSNVENGILEVVLPRMLIDAKHNSEDTSFVVLIDEKKG